MMDTFAFVLVLALAYANGSNDVSKAVATLVGSGVTHYKTAIFWGAIWTTVGAGASIFLTRAMVTTFSRGLLQPEIAFPAVGVLSIVSGAVAWILFASHAGLPVSTTHAIIGAIVGTGLTALPAGAFIWPALGTTILLPLGLSPLLALSLGYLLYLAMCGLAMRWEGTCLCIMPASRAMALDAQSVTRTVVHTTAAAQPIIDVPADCKRSGLKGVMVGLDTGHWLSSGLASFARGANDAPKIGALLLLGSLSTAQPVDTFLSPTVIAIALAMGLGSYLAGHRVTVFLAEHITPMNHIEGLSANLTTSSLVLLSGIMGLPVSTTHVSGSAIIGIGLRHGIHTIQWHTVRNMVLAWVVTVPLSALFASLSYWGLCAMF